MIIAILILACLIQSVCRYETKSTLCSARKYNKDFFYHLQVKYLKVTIAKDIRMKKRITNPITKKYTYQKLPVEQLKISIRNVVKPLSCKPDKSVDELLSNVL